MADVHTHLPAEVVSYDAGTNLVSIQPCIDRMRIDDPNNTESVRLPQIDDVPVHHFGSGKCLLTVAPQPGSYGSYHVSERSLTKWINQGGIATPDNHRKFDISDGFFIPGIYPTIIDGNNGLVEEDISTDRIELRTRTGNTTVAVLDNENVEITADDEITFNQGTDYAVRYDQLKIAFDELKSDFNTFVTVTYNLHNHPTAPPGVVSVPSVVDVPSTADISNSKVSEIRMPGYGLIGP